MKKIFALLLTMIIVATVFVGCSKESEAVNGTTEPTTVVESVDEIIDELTEDVNVESTETDSDGNTIAVGTDDDGNTVEIKTDNNGNVTKTITDKNTGKKTEQTTKAKTTAVTSTDDDFVCTWDNGTVITPNYLTRTFHSVIVKSTLPQIRLHDLRHSVASNLLNKGFSVVQVADWLGHSSSSTTLKFYAHNDKSSKILIANELKNMIAV